MKLSDLRANDLVIKRLLQKIAAANIQNPDYTAIKEILENGADGRYAAAEATEEDNYGENIMTDTIEAKDKNIERLTNALLAAQKIMLQTARVCDAWAHQSRSGGWSTHQVDGNINAANELRKQADYIRQAIEGENA